MTEVHPTLEVEGRKGQAKPGEATFPTARSNNAQVSLLFAKFLATSAKSAL